MADAGKKPAIRVRLYRRRNALKDKVAGIGPKGDGPGGAAEVGIDPDIVAKAEALFAEMAEDYPDWVSGLIVKLAEHHARCVDTPNERRPAFEAIANVAHDMKGQGGTFGYPLITEFAGSLYEAASLKNAYTDNQVEIIKAHIDSMRAVIRERVSGDGGDVGAQLSAGLKQTIAKYKG